jgi:hypothetical protein
MLVSGVIASSLLIGAKLLLIVIGLLLMVADRRLEDTRTAD